MSESDTEVVLEDGDELAPSSDGDVEVVEAVEMVETGALDEATAGSAGPDGAPADPPAAELDELGGPLVVAETMWDATEGRPAPRAASHVLDPVLEVPVSLVVELGRTRMTIGETLRIGRGSIVSLDKDAGEPADLLVNGQLIARGEVVAIDEEFGLRVTEVVSPERRLEAGRG